MVAERLRLRVLEVPKFLGIPPHLVFVDRIATITRDDCNDAVYGSSVQGLVIVKSGPLDGKLGFPMR